MAIVFCCSSHEAKLMKALTSQEIFLLSLCKVFPEYRYPESDLNMDMKHFFFSANFLISYFKHVGKVLVRIFYKFEEFCEKPTNGARQPLPLPPSNCSMVKNQTMKYMLFYKQRFFSAQTQSCLTFS